MCRLGYTYLRKTEYSIGEYCLFFLSNLPSPPPHVETSDEKTRKCSPKILKYILDRSYHPTSMDVIVEISDSQLSSQRFKNLNRQDKLKEFYSVYYSQSIDYSQWLYKKIFFEKGLIL